MKVYCKDCKHYIHFVVECGKEWHWVDSFARRKKEYANPAVKNEDNKCHDWEPNLRYRFRRWMNK